METDEGGRRRKGIPKLRYRGIFKRDIKRAGVKSREWERMVEDRDGWRWLVDRAEQTKCLRPTQDYGEEEGVPRQTDKPG